LPIAWLSSRLQRTTLHRKLLNFKPVQFLGFGSQFTGTETLFHVLILASCAKLRLRGIDLSIGASTAVLSLINGCSFDLSLFPSPVNALTHYIS
jgi:hypothetical protein